MIDLIGIFIIRIYSTYLNLDKSAKEHLIIGKIYAHIFLFHII